MTHPAYTPHEARTRQCFLALMWSLSYPGRGYALPDSGLAAFLVIGETLLDLETSFYCPDEGLAAALSRSGARSLAAADAAYHFFPHLDASQLLILEQASTGTLLHPDQSATLIIGCTLGSGLTFNLSGPGIPTGQAQQLRVDGVPSAFWELRTRTNRYPLGWDVYLIDGAQVVGLPRTTQMALESSGA